MNKGIFKMEIDNFLFLDFETDTHEEFFCASYKLGPIFKQVILNERLLPLAEHKRIDYLTPEAFIAEIIDLAENSIVAAYSEAELQTIKRVVQSENQNALPLQYCNMRAAVKRYINSSPGRKNSFGELPPFLSLANSYQQKKMRYSLASVARLFPVDIPAMYHPGQTSKRFKDVLKGLAAKDGNYAKLTSTQKAKATKALNHNKFDVEVLPIIFDRIFAENPHHIRRSTDIYQM